MSNRQEPDCEQWFNSLSNEFHELVNNTENLNASVEEFLNDLIDEISVGLIFDLHRKYKTNAYDLEVEESCEEEDNDGDIFIQSNLKKVQECVCPICSRVVAAIRFAHHLETCMGLGRQTSRRAVSNAKDKDNSAYSGLPSDDDDDEDWTRRTKKKDRNGAKKNRAAPKKILEPEPVEMVNVDVEGVDDDLTNLRDILHLHDHSNSTSPADSVSSSGSTKKKAKSKSRKNIKKDRISPSSNISIE